MESNRRRSIEGARAALLAQIDALASTFTDIVAASDLVATDDEHDPEGHTIAFERQQVAALLRDARIRLAQLDAALDRLDAGTYGICTTCARPIAAARLDALPDTPHCIDCAP